MMTELSLSQVHQLLEPGPVVLLTTARKGRADVMTMSWHMMVELEPPLVACVVSRRLSQRPESRRARAERAASSLLWVCMNRIAHL